MNLEELKDALCYTGTTTQKLALLLLPRYLAGDEKLDEFKADAGAPFITRQREALVWLLPELYAWNFNYSRDLRETVVGDFVLALSELVRKYHCTPEFQELVIGMSVYLWGSIPGSHELSLELFEAITANMQVNALRELLLKRFRGESIGLDIAAILDAEAAADTPDEQPEYVF